MSVLIYAKYNDHTSCVKGKGYLMYNSKNELSIRGPLLFYTWGPKFVLEDLDLFVNLRIQGRIRVCIKKNQVTAPTELRIEGIDRKYTFEKNTSVTAKIIF